MATATDKRIEEGVEQLLVVMGRFLSGAPLKEESAPVTGLPRWQVAALRLLFVGWAAWAAWTWMQGQHERVIWWTAGAALALLPVLIAAQVAGRRRRRHMRTLVVPLSLALKEVMPVWDDKQRLKAVKIPLDRSFVRIALPDGWHGQDGHKDMLRELVQARMGGAWSAEYNLKRHPFHVLFQPAKQKVKLEVPEKVDFFSDEVQDVIARCEPGQFLLGMAEGFESVIKAMTGETAMWALSVGSGGGKSSFLQMIITQLVAQGATVIGVDVKMASINCFEGVEGIHLYNDPGNIADMRSAISWAAREVEARNYLKEQDPTRTFTRLTLILEEGNEFGDASKEWWTEHKEKGDPAADPIWGDIATIMRMGRHVDVTIIGVFQDLREAAVGNRGLRNMFRLILMGNFNSNQWRMIVNTSPVPESIDRAGRMMVIEGNRRLWIQVPYAEPEDFREVCLQLRAERGYSTADLFGRPPTRSPKRLPSLLQVSQPIGPPGVSLHKALSAGDSAGGDRHAEPRDDERDTHGEPQRDTAPEPVNPPDDETAPEPPAGEGPERLTLAEISRLMADQGLHVKPELMRQHKRRRRDFPAGIRRDGKDLFTYDEIAAYYTRTDDEE
ncbi:hypothetical protein [Streptomyces nanshensis]|uniref:FtsK domain-containing protein n=1 Tax=Streptomyces nanshensis TaxID=518642 RepID=A0A1E7LC05_9ACTN|nr:hypothetical protein [Streptomyces nanshensis]OEV13745.1 hypothetical protein AN218_02105 [Streptomyces nanshensis]